MNACPTDRPVLASQAAMVPNKFSVVVPVLNAKNYIRACLDSILAAISRYSNAELIVLDNGSDDGSYEILVHEYSRRARIEQVRGVGVSALRNFGAGLADGEFLAFIDSDCVIIPDYFENALRILRTRADATGFQQAVPSDSPNWVEKVWVSSQLPSEDSFVRFISAGNFVIHRNAFLAVGGFDPTMVTCEDDDLGLRLNQAGFRIYQSRSVCAFHVAADDSLKVFFFKNAWRSLGMFSLLRKTWLSKPVFITFAHFFLTLAAVLALVFWPAPMLARVGISLVLFNFAPAMAVLYRAWQVRKLYAPFRCLLLYHVYFLARAYTIWNLILALGASPEAKNAMSVRLRSHAKPSPTQLAVVSLSRLQACTSPQASVNQDRSR